MSPIGGTLGEVIFKMFIIKEPRTPEEFSAYYELRWKLLREPWGRPQGSEKDDNEREAYHLMTINTNSKEVVGVGRIHLNNPEEAQIRYMAIVKNYEDQGIGSQILEKLEEHAKEKWEVKRIILNARENALNFYEKFNYKKIKKAHILFGEIPHYRMEKKLD